MRSQVLLFVTLQTRCPQHRLGGLSLRSGRCTRELLHRPLKGRVGGDGRNLGPDGGLEGFGGGGEWTFALVFHALKPPLSVQLYRRVLAGGDDFVGRMAC